jgi:hypothetical protein
VRGSATGPTERRLFCRSLKRVTFSTGPLGHYAVHSFSEELRLCLFRVQLNFLKNLKNRLFSKKYLKVPTLKKKTKAKNWRQEFVLTTLVLFEADSSLGTNVVRTKILAPKCIIRLVVIPIMLDTMDRNFRWVPLISGKSTVGRFGQVGRKTGAGSFWPKLGIFGRFENVWEIERGSFLGRFE